MSFAVERQRSWRRRKEGERQGTEHSVTRNFPRTFPGGDHLAVPEKPAKETSAPRERVVRGRSFDHLGNEMPGNWKSLNALAFVKTLTEIAAANSLRSSSCPLAAFRIRSRSPPGRATNFCCCESESTPIGGARTRDLQNPKDLAPEATAPAKEGENGIFGS